MFISLLNNCSMANFLFIYFICQLINWAMKIWHIFVFTRACFFISNLLCHRNFAHVNEAKLSCCHDNTKGRKLVHQQSSPIIKEKEIPIGDIIRPDSLSFLPSTDDAHIKLLSI